MSDYIKVTDQKAGKLARRKAVLVVAPYLAVGGLWIYGSDKFIYTLNPSPGQLLVWSTLKGFLFLAVTSAILWFSLVRRLQKLFTATARLEQSEARYLDLYENAPDMYLSVELATERIVACNEALVRTTGYTKRELLGRSVFDLYHPDCAAEARQAWATLAATGEVRDVELALRHKDGHRLEISLSESLRRATGGEVTATTRTVWRDIKERQQARRRTTEALRYSQLLLQTAPIGIATFKANGATVAVNAALADMIGASLEEVSAQNFRELNSWRESGMFSAAEEALRTGKIQPREIHHRSSFGRELWLSCLFVPFTHEDAPELLCLFVDITARKQTEQRLEAANARLSAMFEEARDAVILADAATGLIRDVNEEGTRMLQRPKAALVGRHVTVLHPPEFEQKYRQLFAECVQQPRPTPLELEVLRADGTRLIAEISASQIKLPDGNLLIQGIFRDVTPRKKAETELRKLSQAVEQSPVCIVITNAAGDIEYVNPKFTELTGYTAAEARGNNPRILKSGTTQAATYREMWATISSGREWHGEFQNRKKNGDLFWEAASISPLRDAHENITHYIAIKENITAHKAAEKRISDQAALLDQTHDAVLVMGLDHRITYANQSASRLYAHNGTPLLGGKGDALLFPGDAGRCGELCAVTLEQGAWTGEIHEATALGKACTVQSRWILVRDPAGEPASFLITNTDITEKHRLELQLLRGQRMESLGALASGVAHDLNNVLAPIMMSVDFLRPLAQQAQDRQIEEILGMLSASAQRGADIVRQLLIFGRGSEVHRAELQVRTLLKEVARIMKETFPKSITLQALFPPDLWTVQGDPTQIHQVLLNLCVNARDAMPQGGVLTLTAANLTLDEKDVAQNPEAHPGPYVVLEVTDTGHGIPGELLERIFDPFFTTKAPGKGTGLGLSTVLGIAKSHGGFVRVQSRMAGGSQFKIYLPAHHGEAAPEAPALPEPPADGQGELILLVDDEEAVRTVGQRMLEAHGYRVLTAANGAEGIVRYSRRQRDIRAVVTDMLMPVMDGAAMIRVLRQLSPGVRILATTGLPDSADQSFRAEAGVDGFLSKPFRADELITVLRQVLTAPARNPFNFHV